MRCMLHRQLAMTWEEVAVRGSDTQGREACSRRGYICRMLNRRLSQAWEKWQCEAAESKRQAFMVGGAVRCMLHCQLSMVWEKWQFTAAEMKR